MRRQGQILIRWGSRGLMLLAVVMRRMRGIGIRRGLLVIFQNMRLKMINQNIVSIGRGRLKNFQKYWRKKLLVEQIKKQYN